MQSVPYQRQLQTDQYSLRGVPPGGFPEHEQSEPHLRRISAAVRCLPQHHSVDAGDLQSQQHELPADRRAYLGSMRKLPREQQLHNRSNRLLQLSQSRLLGSEQPESCVRWVPHHLCRLPQHDQLVGCDLQSHLVQHEPRQRKRGLCYLPHQLKRLLGVSMHRMSWWRKSEQLPSSERWWLRLQQRELLSVPPKRQRKLIPGPRRTCSISQGNGAIREAVSKCRTCAGPHNGSNGAVQR